MPRNVYTTEESDAMLEELRQELLLHTHADHGHDQYALSDHAHDVVEPPPPPPPEPPPVNGITVPYDADASWFANQQERTFIVPPGTYPQWSGAGRAGDKFFGETRVVRGRKYTTNKEGKILTNYTVDSGPQSLLVSPGNKAPAIDGHPDMEVQGLSLTGYDPDDYRGVNAWSQGGALGGSDGFVRGIVKHVYIFDQPDGYGVRTADGIHLSWFAMENMAHVGFGGRIGWDENTLIELGGVVNAGRHSQSGWESSNKVVVGNGIIRNVYAEACGTAGIWPDIDVDGIEILDNWCVGNELSGIKHEIGGAATIAGNVCEWNGDSAFPGHGHFDASDLDNGGKGAYEFWCNGILIQNSGRMHEVDTPILVSNNIVRFRGVANHAYNAAAAGMAVIHQRARMEHNKQHAAGNITFTGNLVEEYAGGGSKYRRTVESGGPAYAGVRIPTWEEFQALNTLVDV